MFLTGGHIIRSTGMCYNTGGLKFSFAFTGSLVEAIQIMLCVLCYLTLRWKKIESNENRSMSTDIIIFLTLLTAKFPKHLLPKQGLSKSRLQQNNWGPFMTLTFCNFKLHTGVNAKCTVLHVIYSITAMSESCMTMSWSYCTTLVNTVHQCL